MANWWEPKRDAENPLRWMRDADKRQVLAAVTRGARTDTERQQRIDAYNRNAPPGQRL